jgi:prepilin-type N-terminal cleavage/methylation domain-containing protein
VKRWDKKQTGFTIVELLVVVVVIAILASITIVSYNGIQQRATSSVLSSSVASASRLVALYNTEFSKYPAAINDCPSPAAANICINSSGDITLTYQVDNTADPQNYSLVASRGSQKVGMVNGGSIDNEGANLIPAGSAEKTGANEYLRYYNIVSVIDNWGLRPYKISFDIKSVDTSKQNYMQVYGQNGNGAKYIFAANVPVTSSFMRQTVTVTPARGSATEVDSYLSFYGTYGSGNVPTVKNLRVELAN